MTSTSLQQAFGVLSTFWRWWTGELKTMLPSQFRARQEPKTPFLRLTLGEQTCTLTACARSDAEEISRGDDNLEAVLDALSDRRYRQWPIALRLERCLGLRKVIDLPATARADLESLLHFELDRLTPFAADEVFFAWRVAEEDQADGKIKVRVDLAPKAIIQKAVLALRQRGRTFSLIELDGADRRAPLDLTPRSPTTRKTSRWRRILPACVIGLAVLMVAIPLRQQRQAIDKIEAEISRVEPMAVKSAALRERLDDLDNRTNFLPDIKARYAPRTNILTELTRLVPDEAFMTQLQLRDDEIVLVGHADRASDLIGALEQSLFFRSPRFQSPLTRDPRTGKERFQIAARLEAVSD